MAIGHNKFCFVLSQIMFLGFIGTMIAYLGNVKYSQKKMHLFAFFPQQKSTYHVFSNPNKKKGDITLITSNLFYFKLIGPRYI